MTRLEPGEGRWHRAAAPDDAAGAPWDARMRVRASLLPPWRSGREGAFWVGELQGRRVGGWGPADDVVAGVDRHGVALPDDVDPAVAACALPLLHLVRALQRVAPAAEGDVDPNQAVAALLAERGPDARGAPADLIVALDAADPDAALARVRDGGRAILLDPPCGPVTLDLYRHVHRRSLTVLACPLRSPPPDVSVSGALLRAASTFREALRAGAGGLPLDRWNLVTW